MTAIVLVSGFITLATHKENVKKKPNFSTAVNVRMISRETPDDRGPFLCRNQNTRRREGAPFGKQLLVGILVGLPYLSKSER